MGKNAMIHHSYKLIEWILNMIQMTLGELSAIFGTEVKEEDAQKTFEGLSIDTRTLQSGNLFAAIPGTRVDGHDFIDEAYSHGAKVALVTRQINSALPQIKVKDIAIALGELSTIWRSQFNIPIVAVTGSNGKTTLKNMIAAIMVAACHNNPNEVLATEGTLNNHLGLPLTLARLNKNHRYAVIEMGMNHFGEIEYLTKLTQPRVAVITNAAESHLDGVGDVSGVARAKAEIFVGLAPNGVAILNRDDAFFTFWSGLIGNYAYLTFGFHPDADICATTVQNSGQALQKISLHTPSGHINIDLPLLGKHNVLNALAATASALAIGIDLAAIKEGLEQTKPAKGRLQMQTLANGVNIIDDTYNANPFSLQAALATLTTFNGKKILVLGDMKELGADSKSFHHSAGIAIRQAGIDYLFTYGELSANTAEAFGSGAHHFNEQTHLINALRPFLLNGTTILIKGSRSMCMEKVIAELM
jgi:UDP-N-acetylmuramoyl-tripeptide--D-alanyl-D-alanine ligase